jgi:hypothetical protein
VVDQKLLVDYLGRNDELQLQQQPG